MTIEESRANLPKDLVEVLNFICSAKAVVSKLRNRVKGQFDPWGHLEEHAYEDPKSYKEEAVDIFNHYIKIYGGGFYYLNESDIKFLNDNGYVVVMGPDGPECRVG